MESRRPRKILKSPVAKRRSRVTPKDQKVTLERVLGLTSTNNASIACDPNTGTIAYPAGCVVVLYNTKKNKQSHIFNFSKKTLTSLAFSGDGKHLVTGESGHQPAVRVWDVAEKVQVAEHHGHKFGVNCVAFSPNLKYIVSIGTQHDMMVNVWNWRTGSKVASNKVSSKVNSVAFSTDGSMFVTIGMRHVKFWYLDSSKSKINETVPLSGRNGILGDHKNNFFCDGVTGSGKMEKYLFCITQTGLLCQFNEKRQMDKWVELRTTCANCISAAADHIFVGCANGVVRVFNAKTLHFVTTLPRPHHLGVDVAAAVNTSYLSSVKDANQKYPDTIAVAYDEEHGQVTCIYNDHSLYVWDVHDVLKIGKKWSFLYHSSCIYGLEIYPTLTGAQTSILPTNTFLTCSSDDTIRIWNLDNHMAETPFYKSNIYSHELLKVMYMDPALDHLCDVDYNPSGAADKTDTNYDDKNGIRSIRVSPDGQHLASGDRQGNVRIHEMYQLSEIKLLEAHESEVLCLEYSAVDNGPKLLASTSRDRLVHVFDVEQQYGLLQTLSDHSSSITAVKFVDSEGKLKMITCGADKSILFRNLQLDPEFQFTLGHHLVEKMTLYDMDVEPSQKFAAIACQDRNLRIYNVKTGKKKKEYKGSLGDDGILLKMNLDPSGSYAATSCSDKNLCILDFYTGELMATMYGHSEIPTDIRFMNDLKHVLSVSGDGCVFVWRLPQEMTSHMQSRMREMGKLPMHTSLTNGGFKADGLPKHHDMTDAVPLKLDTEFMSPGRVLKEINPPDPAAAVTSPDGVNKQPLDFRFSVSQLPSWAQKRVEDGASSNQASDDQGSGQVPRGRWAQRVDNQGIAVKSQDGKTIEVDLAADRRRFTFEADNIVAQLPHDIRRETIVLNRPDSTPKNVPHILDETKEEEEEEEEEFVPSYSKQDTSHKDNTISWDDLYNFENEELDQSEDQEIIYYPPSEGDGSDSMSSYQVFDAGFNSSQLPTGKCRKSLSANSIADADSETTDPVSLDDTDDDDNSGPSGPSTPLEDLVPKPANREKFLKDTFENLSFTPGLTTDKFVKGLDTLEEEMANTPPTAAVSSRHSISARFLSRSQQANIRNPGMYNSIPRQDNWFDSVQRRKDDMARNLDESRKMLMAMGWKQESPDGEPDSAINGQADSGADNELTPTASKTEKSPEEDQITPTNKFNQTYPVRGRSDPAPSSPRSIKSLRRSWSTLDLPKTPIPEEKLPLSAKALNNKSGKPTIEIYVPNSRLTRTKIPSPQLISQKHIKRNNKRASASSFFPTVYPDKDSNTPTSGKTSDGPRGRTRPRTLQLDQDDKKNTPTNTAQRKPETRTSLGGNRRATPTGPPANKIGDTKNKVSRVSTSNLHKLESVQEPRRSSTGSNLSKSKSGLMTSLNAQKENKPSKDSHRPRSKWSSSKMASFASVPNLLAPDDDEEFTAPPTNLEKSKSQSRSNPDLTEDNDKTVRNSKANISEPSSPYKRRSVQPEKRSASTSRVSGGTAKALAEEKKSTVFRKVGASVSSLKGGNDRDLMPPPAITNVAKTKPETKFVKRAQQAARRKTTSDISLEEAKDILKGNSGILNGDKGKRRNSAVGSSSPPNVAPEVRPRSANDKEDLDMITDPRILDVASEIEKTAAEIRRQSGSQSQYSSLAVSPFEPPEHDNSPERDIPNRHKDSAKYSNSSRSGAHINVEIEPVSKLNTSISDTSLSRSPVSNTSTNEEEDYPSPSVKERIAKLNKKVSDTDQTNDSSPNKDRLGSQSPVRDMRQASSPRITSSTQFSFLQSRTDLTSTTASSFTPTSAPIVTMATSTVTMTTTSSASTPSRMSVSKSGHQMAPIPFDSGNEIRHSEPDHVRPIGVSGTSPARKGASSYSVDSLGSQDSETLAPHLSPGSYHSPQSGTDTGLGSDLDTDCSNSMTSSTLRERLGFDNVAVDGLKQTLQQLQALTNLATMYYRQLQNQSDERSCEAKTMFREGYLDLHSTMCDVLSIPDNTNNNNRLDHQTKTIPLQTYQGLIEKISELGQLSADMKEYSGT